MIKDNFLTIGRGYINFSFVVLNLLHQVPDLEKSFIQMLQLLRPESRQR